MSLFASSSGSWFIPVIMFMLSVALCLGFWRLVRGPSLPDRVVALDLIVFVAVGIMATYAVDTGESVYLDTAIIIALINFLATLGFARHLEIRTFKREEKQP